MIKNIMIALLIIALCVSVVLAQTPTPTVPAIPAGWTFDAAGSEYPQFVVAPDGRRWKISEFDAAGEGAKATAIKNLLASSVGVAIADLSAAQRNALVAALLYQAGAIDKDLKIRPMADWLK